MAMARCSLSAKKKKKQVKTQRKIRTRMTSDGSPDLVRCQTVDCARAEARKNKVKSGPKLPAFDGAMCGAFICKTETIRDKYSRRNDELEGKP